MSSTNPKAFKSCLITLLQLFFGLPLLLLYSKHSIVSHLLTGASLGLLLICPNHILVSLILSSINATSILPLISSFLILSSLAWPQIQRIILISATLILWTYDLLIGQHSAPYNKGGCWLLEYKTQERRWIVFLSDFRKQSVSLILLAVPN